MGNDSVVETGSIEMRIRRDGQDPFGFVVDHDEGRWQGNDVGFINPKRCVHGQLGRWTGNEDPVVIVGVVVAVTLWISRRTLLGLSLLLLRVAPPTPYALLLEQIKAFGSRPLTSLRQDAIGAKEILLFLALFT